MFERDALQDTNSTNIITWSVWVDAFFSSSQTYVSESNSRHKSRALSTTLVSPAGTHIFNDILRANKYNGYNNVSLRFDLQARPRFVLINNYSIAAFSTTWVTLDYERCRADALFVMTTFNFLYFCVPHDTTRFIQAEKLL